MSRIPHAFLLRGPAGSGKRTFAAHWANALVCEHSDLSERPCRRCRSCRLFAAKTHPDVREITPPSDKKAIGIDQIRALIDYVWLSRQFAQQKIVMIPGAQDMTLSAANTLLKTLEEPPGSVVFILISDQSDALPTTIRSRCQFLDFPTPPRAQVLPWLQEQLPPDVDANLALDAASGAPLLALRYGNEDIVPKRAELYRELTELLQGRADPLTVAARWKTLGSSVVLPWIGNYITDLIRLRFSTGKQFTVRGEYSGDRAPDHRAGMEQVAATLDLVYGYRLLDRYLEIRRAQGDAINLNEALLLEGIAIDFHLSTDVS